MLQDAGKLIGEQPDGKVFNLPTVGKYGPVINGRLPAVLDGGAGGARIRDQWIRFWRFSMTLTGFRYFPVPQEIPVAVGSQRMPADSGRVRSITDELWLTKICRDITSASVVAPARRLSGCSVPEDRVAG